VSWRAILVGKKRCGGREPAHLVLDPGAQTGLASAPPRSSLFGKKPINIHYDYIASFSTFPTTIFYAVHSYSCTWYCVEFYSQDFYPVEF
jgi:hypothetical protein